MLTKVPLETNAEDVPAINVDSEIATITNDAVDALRITASFHEFSRSTHEIRNQATAMVTVEMSANARCTTARSRIYRRDITTDVLTAITGEKVITMNTDGAAVRHVRFVHQDFTDANLGPNEVLVWQVNIWGRQVAANVIPSFLTLWFRRGTFDCKLETEVVSEAEA
jgi:type IV secretory pathway TrbD component